MFNERLTAFRLRIKTLFKRRQLDRDLADELAFHLAMRETKEAESGMSPDEAHCAARRQFGNQTLLKEATHDMWTFVWLESLWQDLRYGLRQLCRSPGFTAIAIITLGLGIGANTAIFSVVNAVLIRPLPYADPGSLVWVSDYIPAMKNEAVTDPDYEVWRNQNKVFEQLAAYGGGADYNLTGQGRPQRVTGWAVTANFLPLLGIRPTLGRDFLPEEDLPGSDLNTPRVPVVIITHRLWDRLGSSLKILGKQLMLDGTPYSVVGVLPANFGFPGESQPDLLRPAGLSPKPVWDMRKPMLLMRVIGRLKPGVTIQQAQSDVAVMNQWIRAQLPPGFARMAAGTRAEVIPLHRQLVGSARTFLLILFGAVGFVLLIACVNVANLQMERTTTRRKEIALRMAIGAGRGRVMRRLLVESLFLALLGSIVALAIAFGGIRVLRTLAPPEIPNPSAITLDP
ncbi:MAG: ABC transporter permease [Terriglobia bacterium]